MNTSVIQEASTHIQIPISELHTGHTDIDGNLLARMQSELEGKCDNYGYILPDSVGITHKSAGKLLSVNRCSKVDYEIHYTFQSLRPSPRDTYTCVIDSRSKMGLIAYLQEYNSLSESPILFIIPQPFLQGKEESYTIGNTIQVEVIESRIKYKNTQIQAVCKPM